MDHAQGLSPGGGDAERPRPSALGAATLLLALVTLVACSAPPAAAGPTSRAGAEAPAPARAPHAAELPPLPEQPKRTYGDRGAAVAVDVRASGSERGVLSPDGALLATTVPEGVAFIDVDRGIVVGRTPVPAALGGVHSLRWIDDATLAGATAGSVVTFDGRTGALRQVAPGSLLGFVETRRGPAFVTVAGSEPAASRRVSLRLVASPADVLLSVVATAPVEAVLAGPSDGFLVVTESGASLHDASGATRWRRDDELTGLGLDPRSGAAVWMETRTEVLDVATAAPSPELTAHVRGRRDRLGKAPPPPPDGVPGGAVEVARTASYTLPTLVDDALRAAAAPLSTATQGGVVTVIDRAHGERHAVGRFKGDPFRVDVARRGRFVTVATLDQTHVFRTEPAGDGPRAPLLSLADRCELGVAKNGAARVAICAKGAFDVRGAGTPGFVPRPLDVPREASDDVRFATAGDAGFVARCGELAPAVLGSAPVVPPAEPEEEHPGFRTSPDGRLRATYGPPVNDEFHESPSQVGTSTRVALTSVADERPLRMLDQGELVLHFAFHPSGVLVVAGVTTVKLWSPHDGKLARTLPGSDFALSPDGRWLFVSSDRDAAIYEWATMRLVGRWSGSLRVRGVSASGAFALLHEVRKSSATLGWYTVALHVVDLRSSRTRFIVQGDESGFAFAPDDKTMAIAPLASDELRMRDSRAARVDVREMTIGRVVSSFEAPSGAERLFFSRDGEVLGVHTAGGVHLHRRGTDRRLDLLAFASGGRCRAYAFDPRAGSFDGDAEGAVGYRLGDDLRTSEVVTSGPRFEAFRRAGMVGAFLEGR